MSATYTKINDFIELIAQSATLDRAFGDTYGIALSNTAPAAESSDPTADGNGILGNVTQIDYTNYADTLTTDRVLEGISGAFSGGIFTLDADNFVISASGGQLAEWRYLYVYNDTLANDPLVAVWDYGAGVELAENDQAAVNFAATGLLRIS
jgi:hypothetical protein